FRDGGGPLVELEDSRFTLNIADVNGGAVDAGDVAMDGCTFTSNWADEDGGAVHSFGRVAGTDSPVGTNIGGPGGAAAAGGGGGGAGGRHVPEEGRRRGGWAVRRGRGLDRGRCDRDPGQRRQPPVRRSGRRPRPERVCGTRQLDRRDLRRELGRSARR